MQLKQVRSEGIQKYSEQVQVPKMRRKVQSVAWESLPCDSLYEILSFLAPLPHPDVGSDIKERWPENHSAQRDTLISLLTLRLVCRGWSVACESFDTWMWRRLYNSRYRVIPASQLSQDQRKKMIHTPSLVVCTCMSTQQHNWKALFRARILAQAQISLLQRERVLLRMQCLSARGKHAPAPRARALVCRVCCCCAVFQTAQEALKHLKVHHNLKLLPTVNKRRLN